MRPTHLQLRQLGGHLGLGALHSRLGVCQRRQLGSQASSLLPGGAQLGCRRQDRVGGMVLMPVGDHSLLRARQLAAHAIPALPVPPLILLPPTPTPTCQARHLLLRRRQLSGGARQLALLALQASLSCRQISVQPGGALLQLLALGGGTLQGRLKLCIVGSCAADLACRVGGSASTGCARLRNRQRTTGEQSMPCQQDSTRDRSAAAAAGGGRTLQAGNGGCLLLNLGLQGALALCR